MSILDRMQRKNTGAIAQLYNDMLKNVSNESLNIDVDQMRDMVGVGVEKLNDAQKEEFSAALESLDQQAAHVMNEGDRKALETNLTDGLEDLSEDQLGTVGGKFDVANMKTFTRMQRDAAAMGFAAATNPTSIWARTPGQAGGTSGAMGSQQASAGTTDVGRVSAALEAYDESAAVQTQVMSYVYNLAVSRQDIFTETVWPTLVVGPDEIGVTVTMEILSVQEEYFRDISGRHKKMFGRKNLAKALIYPGILNNDTTKLVPVYSDSDPVNQANFVDAADIPPEEIVLENGFTVKTSALKMNAKKTVDLLGLSQPDYLVAAGLLNETDQLDPKVAIATIYIKLKNGKILKFAHLEGLPAAEFTPGAQGSARTLNLNFSHAHMAVTPKTVYNDQSEIDGVIKTSKATARIDVDVRGEVSLNDGGLRLHAAPVSLTDVHNEEGELLAEADATYKQVEEFFEDAEVIGYKLSARRLNTNRREIGQLLAINRESFTYRIPTLAPITWRRSTADGDVDDGAKLENLIKTTYIRCSVEAVTRLIATAEHLATLPEGYFEPELVDSNTCLGMARYLIEPYYRHYTLDVFDQLSSLRSNDRIVDVQAVLINAMRDAWYKAYILSGYEAACRVLYGANAPKPRVTIATDPYTAMYLSLDGDVRTFGHGFEVDVVSSSDERMRDEVYIIPGKFSSGANNDTFNPMHFGNRLHRVEIVSAMPIDRAGQTSHEITVQPSFDFYCNCPIMVRFSIRNLRMAVSEMVPIFQESVDVRAEKKKKEEEEKKKKANP